MKKNNIVAARLNDKEYAEFLKFRGDDRTTYSAVKELVMKGLSDAPPEPVTTGEPPTVSGNFAADVEAASKHPPNKLQQWLKETGWAKETTASAIKKSGAYHDENLIMELHAMIEHGRPDLFEIKYFVDLAYYRAVLARALLLTGAKSTMAKKVWGEANWRPAMPKFSKSEAQRRTHRYKAARSTSRGFTPE